MSGREANCPNCGGALRFLWADAVQSTCPYCGTIVVRTDVDLHAVGRQSAPPPDTSPIQRETTGTYRGRRFTVVGRIAYEYERGAWSEWYLRFADGGDGWLSDAQLEYAVTFAARPTVPLAPPDRVAVGQVLQHDGVAYQVASVTVAGYRGVEGELPFEYWGKERVPFVDLRSADGRLATVDYSETPPLLFAGEFVSFESLALRHLREEAPAPRVSGTKGLNCPSCGTAVTLRDPEHAVNVVCGSCGAVLDATSPALAILQTYRRQAAVAKPLIPLGSKGKWHGDEYEVIGFQRRTITVEGVQYSWHEYLLHGRAKGYRYLTEYDGHWNWVVGLQGIPQEGTEAGRPWARYEGKQYKHFQRAQAETTFVLGEFPWQVRYGDRVQADDFVAPPLLLSAERTPKETTWSLGEYTPGARVWEAFGLKGSPPPARGVFANQPSPHDASSGRYWLAFCAFLVVLLVVGVFRMSTGGDQVWSGSFDFSPRDTASAAVVTPSFDLGGRTSNVEVEIETNLDNASAFFDVSLIDEGTGVVRELGREVSYYHGVDGGESWSEGDRTDETRISSVPPGRYFLRIGVDGDQAVKYDVRLRRDAPSGTFWLLALLALAVPPVLALFRAGMFETQRWAESDYAPSGSDDDDD
jgi:predicted RNA-binding Zn-ribbon protein involved in translation (DUF1610 family)